MPFFFNLGGGVGGHLLLSRHKQMVRYERWVSVTCLFIFWKTQPVKFIRVQWERQKNNNKSAEVKKKQDYELV